MVCSLYGVRRYMRIWYTPVYTALWCRPRVYVNVCRPRAACTNAVMVYTASFGQVTAEEMQQIERLEALVTPMGLDRQVACAVR